MRLIDADKLLNDMKRNCIGNCDRCDEHTILSSDLHCGLVDRQPTIQPQGYDKKRLLEGLGKLNQWTQFAEHWFKVDEVYALIKSQPTTDGWIPCSKELPKEEGWYQCSCYSPERWSKGLVRDLYWYPTSQQFVDNIRYSTNGFDDIKKYYWTEWVIAWQPLPQPYKESK